MLPFMKPKMQTGVIVKDRKSDGLQSPSEQDGSGLEACAEDMIRALSAKDSKMLAKAVRAAFEILDAEPHEEGPHLNEEAE